MMESISPPLLSPPTPPPPPVVEPAQPPFQPSGNGVADVFADRCVLVTGASGFLGKVLVEKLLYSMQRIRKIYLLIRATKHEMAAHRLEKMLQSPIFNRLRCTDTTLFEKLVPITGDLMKPDLGIAEADLRTLCERVAIVFHCAATVKFDEPLRVSVQMNVVGTQRLVALCHKMPQLISIVHASTAYANCNLRATKEHIYDPCTDSGVPPAKLTEAAADWMSTPMLDALTPQLLAQRPNTYTFAKALAESLLRTDAVGLPLIIVRPSIIGAIWREPLPGWTDNVNGPTGLFAAVGKGILTNMCGNAHANADIIPVDIVSNTLIAAAAYRARLTPPTTVVVPHGTSPLVNTASHTTTDCGADASTAIYRHRRGDEIPVVHCCSGSLNPLKWGRIVAYLEQFYRKYPLDECLRVPSTHFHSSRSLFLISFYLKHYLPAYAVDAAMRLAMRKPKMVRMYGKVWKMVETLHYFTARGWHFESRNIITLWNSLTDTDKKIYNFDIRQLDWDRYLFDYLMGVKVYLLREKLEDIPKARSNLAWVRQLSFYINAAGWALLVRLLARNQSRRRQWTVWFLGCLSSYAAERYGHAWRPRLYLKSIEEYRKSALPTYA